MNHLGWMKLVFSLHWRKIFTYRFNFWVSLIVVILIEMMVAFFMWKNIFLSSTSAMIGGLTFDQMMFYYLVGAFLFKAISGPPMYFIGSDIYDGGLNKYLIYPLPYFLYKLIEQYVHTTFYLIQLLIGIGLFYLIWGAHFSTTLTISHLIIFILLTLAASYLYFMMTAIVEFIAFWVDNMWTLLVLLRLTVLLLGGAMIPLSLFPDWAREILPYFPFSQLIYYPIATLMNQVSMSKIAFNFGILFFWSLLFTLIATWVWKRGLKNYSGVGI